MLYLRKEYFGSIIYNSKLAQYYNLSHEQTACLLDYIQFGKISTATQQLLTELNKHSNLSFQIIQPKNISRTNLSASIKVFFNITKKCNLFCRHCYNNSGHNDSPELPYPQIIHALNELYHRGIFKVTLAGGEPLFHPDFDQIMDHIQTTDLAISIVTNGICVSKQRVKRLEQNLNLRSITVSLDGANADDNDAVRGLGAFAKTLRGLKILRSHYTRELAIRITIMRSNISHVDKLPALVADLGIKEIKVNGINAYGRAQESTGLYISAEEYKTARDKLYESATRYGISVEVPAHKYQRDENDQVGLCKAGEETFEIDGDGSVYPCSFSFGRFLAGNIQHDNFDSIFERLQQHSINNPWCYSCKGRGGKAEKVFGKVPTLIKLINTANPS